jgi:hypothetical protein
MLTEDTLGEFVNDKEPGLPLVCRAFSARSALKSISRGDSRAGTGIGAPRDGEGGEGVGDEAESEPSSGGVGGPDRALAGTDFERNLGIGSAEGAGDAWNVGPA